VNRHKKYRTVIIEPSEIIREGIRLFLERHGLFQVTACFSDIQSFTDRTIRADFQLVLLNPAVVEFHKPFNVRNLFADYPDVCLIAVVYQYINP